MGRWQSSTVFTRCGPIEFCKQQCEIDPRLASCAAHGHNPCGPTNIGILATPAEEDLSSLRPSANDIGHLHVPRDLVHERYPFIDFYSFCASIGVVIVGAYRSLIRSPI
jgi:hypothetical protein